MKRKNVTKRRQRARKAHLALLSLLAFCSAFGPAISAQGQERQGAEAGGVLKGSLEINQWSKKKSTGTTGRAPARSRGKGRAPVRRIKTTPPKKSSSGSPKKKEATARAESPKRDKASKEALKIHVVKEGKIEPEKGMLYIRVGDRTFAAPAPSPRAQEQRTLQARAEAARAEERKRAATLKAQAHAAQLNARIEQENEELRLTRDLQQANAQLQASARRRAAQAQINQPMGNTGAPIMNSRARDGSLGPLGAIGPAGPKGPGGPLGVLGPAGPDGPAGPLGPGGPAGPGSPWSPAGISVGRRGSFRVAPGGRVQLGGGRGIQVAPGGSVQVSPGGVVNYGQ